MKFLSVAGTIAMFLVGGGILVHKVKFLHHWVEYVSHLASTVPAIGVIAEKVSGMLMETLIGLVAGAIVLLVVTLLRMGFTRRVDAKA
jgi:predicted DNA repair protein MutK